MQRPYVVGISIIPLLHVSKVKIFLRGSLLPQSSPSYSAGEPARSLRAGWQAPGFSFPLRTSCGKGTSEFSLLPTCSGSGEAPGGGWGSSGPPWLQLRAASPVPCGARCWGAQGPPPSTHTPQTRGLRATCHKVSSVCTATPWVGARCPSQASVGPVCMRAPRRMAGIPSPAQGTSPRPGSALAGLWSLLPGGGELVVIPRSNRR